MSQIENNGKEIVVMPNQQFISRSVAAGDMFSHCFDLGVFVLLRDNGDGTGLFYKEDDIDGLSMVRKEVRSTVCSWRTMTPIDPRLNLLVD